METRIEIADKIAKIITGWLFLIRYLVLKATYITKIVIKIRTKKFALIKRREKQISIKAKI